jgi:soluble lytic murein transglycosylase-like protein
MIGQDSSDITQIIADAAAQAGIDPNLAIAVAVQESALNPNAVSPVGAQGLFQLMPATAASLGVSDPFDPQQSATAGCTYLAQMLAMFGGDTSKALGAYNWGPGNVQKAVVAYGPNWLAHAPAETQHYVSAILGGLSSAPPAIDVPGTASNLAVGAVSAFSNLTNLPPQTLAMLGGAVILGWFLLQDLLD